MITPTTEIEAVNTLLRAIGESPVSSLSGEVGVDVVTAKATLLEVLKAVQAEGWLFNTEDDYPLPCDRAGHIHVPRNALSLDINHRRFAHIDPVQRGSKLYDRKNHTYVFTQALAATIIFGLPFDEMPETARTYITYRAARKFQDTSLGAQELHAYNEREELAARIRMVDEQAADRDLNFLRDDPSFGGMFN